MIKLEREDRKNAAFFFGFIFLACVCAFAALAAQDPKTPELPDKNRADILTIQLHLVQTQNQYTQLQTQMKQLEDDYKKYIAQLQTAQQDGCKAAKVDCEKQWTLDLQTLTFEKKAAPAPPPAGKKP